MASPEHVFVLTETGFKEHVTRRLAGLPQEQLDRFYVLTRPVSEWHDDPNYIARRRETSTSGLQDVTHYRVDDGNAIEQAWSHASETYKETLDVLYGQDARGRWLGGPFSSYTSEKRRSYSGWWTGSVVNQPKFLWPPESFYHQDRYSPPFLASLPTFATSFLPNGLPDANPANIQRFIQLAMDRVQGARNSARPDTNYSDFGVAIAELRETAQLVTIKGNSLVAIASSSLLMTEFGWKPLISDIRKLLEMSVSIKKRIDFLRRNVGKPIRRERLLYNYTDTLGKVDELTFGPAGTFNTVVPEEGTYDIASDLSVVAKYHSLLSYTLPSSDELGWDEKSYRVLTGLTLDGSTVWESLPWTWLIDWFTNIGDFVEKRFRTRLADVTLLDEWVTVNVIVRQSCTIATVAGPGSQPDVANGNATTVRKDELKWRGIPPEQAPLTLADLFMISPRQLAILLALKGRYKK